MNQAPWTAGPWQWDCGLVPPDGPRRYAEIYKDGGDLVIAQFNNLIPEGKANARLICASPALYEALERALPLLEAWADDASNDVGACSQEGGRPTEVELQRMRSSAALANDARAALLLARGGGE